jgi:hypothetical protein
MNVGDIKTRLAGIEVELVNNHNAFEEARQRRFVNNGIEYDEFHRKYFAEYAGPTVQEQEEQWSLF